MGVPPVQKGRPARPTIIIKIVSYLIRDPYFAPASSACSIVQSILLNQSRLLPCTPYLHGEYGVQDIFLGVPWRLGYQGVEEVVELELSDTETAAFMESGKLVAQNTEEARAILKTAS